jgi:hypothetical protein
MAHNIPTLKQSTKRTIIMKSEFSANSILNVQRQISEIKDNIRNHYGIVPASWYDQLDALEIQILKATQNDQ